MTKNLVPLPPSAKEQHYQPVDSAGALFLGNNDPLVNLVYNTGIHWILIIYF